MEPLTKVHSTLKNQEHSTHNSNEFTTGIKINDFYTQPPTYNSFFQKVMELRNEFPFLNVFPIGQSVMGRKLLALSIGNTSKVTLMAGAFHAQEWLTTSLLIRYIEHLSLAIRENTTIAGVKISTDLEQRGIIFVPMVNPDGVSIALEGAKSAGRLADFVSDIQSTSEKSWQANARGIDLNHNFDAGFNQLRQLEEEMGITKPSARQYGGKSPHSEPESKAMVHLCAKYNIETAYAFHSQGEEIFFEYGNNTPVKSLFIAKMISQANDYELVKNDGLYSHGGFKDYFIQKYSRPAFTIEIGKGENPLPLSMLEDIYTKLLESLVIMSVI